jgi:hypothetical protein
MFLFVVLEPLPAFQTNHGLDPIKAESHGAWRKAVCGEQNETNHSLEWEIENWAKKTTKENEVTTA